MVVDGWMDVCMDGWMDGWMDGDTEGGGFNSRYFPRSISISKENINLYDGKASIWKSMGTAQLPATWQPASDTGFLTPSHHPRLHLYMAL